MDHFIQFVVCRECLWKKLRSTSCHPNPSFCPIVVSLLFTSDAWFAAYQYLLLFLVIARTIENLVKESLTSVDTLELYNKNIVHNKEIYRCANMIIFSLLIVLLCTVEMLNHHVFMSDFFNKVI